MTIIVETTRKALEDEILRLEQLLCFSNNRSNYGFIAGALMALRWVNEGSDKPSDLGFKLAAGVLADKEGMGDGS